MYLTLPPFIILIIITNARKLTGRALSLLHIFNKKIMVRQISIRNPKTPYDYKREFRNNVLTSSGWLIAFTMRYMAYLRT